MRLFVLLVATALSACEAGEVTLVQPQETADGANLLEVRVMLEDTALAAEVGWSAGVPSVNSQWAFVEHWRYLFREGESDSTGVLRLEREGAGMHWIAAEKSIVIAGAQRVFGGGLQTRGDDSELSLHLDNPGTLVISEVHMDSPPPWETAGMGYDGSKYVELYNNSERVVYLDAMVLGVAYPVSWDFSHNGHHSCSYTAQFREDPDAVWSAGHWRFPGTGNDHPIGPGEAIVVAVSAADHTQVHPDMLDLTDAEFEFREGGAADNPAAPDLSNLGTDTQRNHFLLGSAFWFLSAPVEVQNLPMLTDDDFPRGGDTDYRGFPADAMLDVALIWWDATSATFNARDAPPCDYPIHPSFDALPGGYLYGQARPADLLISPQRRVVRIEDGRRILLDTNTSKVDFENLPRTPGWIP